MTKTKFCIQSNFQNAKWSKKNTKARKSSCVNARAIASPCYSGGGGGPSTKNFFPSLNMYQAKSSVKNFSLYWGRGGPPWQKIFPQSEHVSSQIWCQKFFPLLGEGGSLDKNFFPHSQHVSSQIWCQNFFPLLGGWGDSLDKNFFSQSEHVSSHIWCQKFSPLLGGGPSTKNFFPSLNMYQAKSGIKNFSLYWGGGVGIPWQKIFFPVWTCIKPNLVSKNFPFTETGTPPRTWDRVPPSNLRPGRPPYPDLDLGAPLYLDLGPPLPGPGTPPTWTWDRVPPPPLDVWTDTQSENITFPILRMRAVIIWLTQFGSRDVSSEKCCTNDITTNTQLHLNYWFHTRI